MDAELHQAVVAERQLDLDVRGVGVLADVGERFERRAMQGERDRGADRPRRARDRQGDAEPLVARRLDERRDLFGDAIDAALFAQRLHGLADGREPVLGQRLRARHRQHAAFRIAADDRARGFELDVNHRQVMPQRVVDLARHAVALVRGGELRDFGGQRFGALPRLTFALRDADVDDHEHHGRRRLGDVAQPVRPCRHPRQGAADAGDDEQAHPGGQRARQQDDRLRGQRQQNQRQAACPRQPVDAHADRELDQQVRQRDRHAAPPAGIVESRDPEQEIQPAERQQLRPRDLLHHHHVGPRRQRDQREVRRRDHGHERPVADDGVAARG